VDESGTCPARYVTRPERQLRVAFQLDILRQVEEILVDNIEFPEQRTQRREGGSRCSDLRNKQKQYGNDFRYVANDVDVRRPGRLDASSPLVKHT
jgi:hypothetical protein